jgi:hypothetical protein
VVAQTQIVVGAEVDDVSVVLQGHGAALGGREDVLGLVSAGLAHGLFAGGEETALAKRVSAVFHG